MWDFRSWLILDLKHAAHIWIYSQCHGGRFRDSQARGGPVEGRNVPAAQWWKKWKCGRRFWQAWSCVWNRPRLRRRTQLNNLWLLMETRILFTPGVRAVLLCSSTVHYFRTRVTLFLFSKKGTVGLWIMKWYSKMPYKCINYLPHYKTHVTASVFSKKLNPAHLIYDCIWVLPHCWQHYGYRSQEHRWVIHTGPERGMNLKKNKLVLLYVVLYVHFGSVFKVCKVHFLFFFPPIFMNLW